MVETENVYGPAALRWLQARKIVDDEGNIIDQTVLNSISDDNENAWSEDTKQLADERGITADYVDGTDDYVDIYRYLYYTSEHNKIQKELHPEDVNDAKYSFECPSLQEMLRIDKGFNQYRTNETHTDDDASNADVAERSSQPEPVAPEPQITDGDKDMPNAAQPDTINTDQIEERQDLDKDHENNEESQDQDLITIESVCNLDLQRNLFAVTSRNSNNRIDIEIIRGNKDFTDQKGEWWQTKIKELAHGYRTCMSKQKKNQHFTIKEFGMYNGSYPNWLLPRIMMNTLSTESGFRRMYSKYSLNRSFDIEQGRGCKGGTHNQQSFKRRKLQ